MFNLKRAMIPGVAGVTIGALLVGAFSVAGSRNTTSALAAPAPVNPAATASRSTSFQLVNMGTATATTVVKFYNQSTGSLLANYQPSKSLAPGESMLLDQRFDNNIANGFAGSGVAESSQQQAGIVVEFASDGGTDAYNAIASSEVGNSAVCPVALGNVSGQGGKVYNTIIHVQGAGSTASNVTATFVNSTGSTVKSSTHTVQPGASQSIVLETDSQLNGFFGAVNLTSDQPIAAAAEQYTGGQLIDYTCFSAGGTEIYAPAVFRIDNFYRTSTIISNLSTSAAGVNLQFTDSSDPAKNVAFTDSIPAQSAKVYDQGFDNGGKTPLANGFFGSLKVTSDQNVAVLVEELSNGDIQGLAYRGIPSTSLAKKVVLPSIFSQIVDSTSGIDFSTSFAVMNPNGSTANLTMSFAPLAGGGSAANSTQTVNANSAKVFEQRPIVGATTVFDTAGNFGSVTITSDQNIAVIVNGVISKAQEANANQFKDPNFGYNGIPTS